MDVISREVVYSLRKTAKKLSDKLEFDSTIVEKNEEREWRWPISTRHTHIISAIKILEFALEWTDELRG